MPAGLLKTTTSPLGLVVTNAYDNKGNLRQVTNNLTALVTTMTYDTLGRALTRTETWTNPTPGTATTTFTYDEVGNVLTTTGPQVINPITAVAHQLRVTTSFNRNNNPTQVVASDVVGGDLSRTTLFGYDVMDRQVQVTDPEGAVTMREFDAVGRVSRVRDANGNWTRTNYDARNLATSVVAEQFDTDPADAGNPTPDITLSTMEYDQAGRLTATVDALGRRTEHEYTDADRLNTSWLRNFDDRSGALRDIRVANVEYDPAGNVTQTLAGGDWYDSDTYEVNNSYDPVGWVQTSSVAVTPTPNVETRDDLYYRNNAGQVIETWRDQTINGSQQVRQTFATYDTAGRTTSTSMTSGGSYDPTTTYTYDDRGNQIMMVPPKGNKPGNTPATYRVTRTYDLAGRISTVVSPTVAAESAGGTPTNVTPTVTYGYNTFGDLTHVRDERNNVTVSTFDRDGRIARVDHPAYTPPGGSAITPYEQWTFDGNGNIAAYRNRRGYVTNYDYDDANRPVRQTDPAVGVNPRGVHRNLFDNAGNLTSTVDPVGATVTMTYDDLNRVRSSTQVVRSMVVHANGTFDYGSSGGSGDHVVAGGSYVTWFAYDDVGRVLTVEAPNGTITENNWNRVGELLWSEDQADKRTTYTYNIDGNPERITDPLGRQTRFTYDPLGRQLTQGRYTAGGTLISQTSTVYDENNNPITLTDGLGHATTQSFDALDRLTGVTQPTSATTNFTFSYFYDAAGNNTRVRDGRSNDWITTYQPWGLVEDTREPSTTAHPNLVDRTFTNVYDAGGLQVEYRQPGAITVTTAYDELGRPVTENAGGSPKVFTYDLNGQPLTASNNGVTLAYAYDDRGLLLRSVGAGDARYTYDNVGRTSQRIDPSGTHTFTWNTRNLLASQNEPLTGTNITYGYNDAQQPTTASIVNGTNTSTRTWTYDTAGRLASDTFTKPGGTVTMAAAYTYDNNDNTLTENLTLPGNSQAGNHVYTYDWANRLKTWKRASDLATTYTWDNNSNLTATKVGTGATQTRTYDQRNRLLVAPDGTYTWTPRGTLSQVVNGAVTTGFTYDGFGRQTQTTVSGAGTANYTYDALDRINTRNSVAFTYNAGDLDPTSDGNNTYSRGLGALLAINHPTNGTILVGQNRHGDLRWLYNTAGVTTDTRTYDPLGKPITNTGTYVNTAGYQADWTETFTGDIWMGARWYAPGNNSFRSRDTYRGTLQHPSASTATPTPTPTPSATGTPTGIPASTSTKLPDAWPKQPPTPTPPSSPNKPPPSPTTHPHHQRSTGSKYNDESTNKPPPQPPSTPPHHPTSTGTKSHADKTPSHQSTGTKSPSTPSTGTPSPTCKTMRTAPQPPTKPNNRST